MERGTLMRARPVLAGERLRVVAEVRSPSGEVREVSLPDREVAALLPRSILLGGSCRAPLSMLDTLEPILSRMTVGRVVRMWQYADRWYCSFLPWKSVRFVPEDAGPPSAALPAIGLAAEDPAEGATAMGDTVGGTPPEVRSAMGGQEPEK
jgi:hypothetical protein